MSVYLSKTVFQSENFKILHENPHAMTEAVAKATSDHNILVEQRRTQVIMGVALIALGTLTAVFVDWRIGLCVGILVVFPSLNIRQLNSREPELLRIWKVAKREQESFVEVILMRAPVQSDPWLMLKLAKAQQIRTVAALHAKGIVWRGVGLTAKLELMTELLKKVFKEKDTGELRWECLISARKQPGKVEKLLQTDISEEAKELLSLGIRCSTGGVILSSNGGYRAIEFQVSPEGEPSCRNEETQRLVKEIHEKMKIERLEISSDAFTQDDLIILAGLLPDLSSLIIKNKQITSIPEAWQKSLKHLRCTCESVKTLNLPQVEVLYCYHCDHLETLEAVNAHTVDRSGCGKLHILNIPNAV